LFLSASPTGGKAAEIVNTRQSLAPAALGCFLRLRRFVIKAPKAQNSRKLLARGFASCFFIPAAPPLVGKADTKNAASMIVKSY
jgi:hypothetical protein